MDGSSSERTPAFKLALAIGVAFLLSIPLFSIYLLAYDRQSQMRDATDSITAGWGGAQAMNGPVLVIPYRATATETVVENGQIVIRPINFLAQSYDHRIIDGREAVLSLVAIKEALEDPARMLLDL